MIQKQVGQYLCSIEEGRVELTRSRSLLGWAAGFAAVGLPALGWILLSQPGSCSDNAGLCAGSFVLALVTLPIALGSLILWLDAPLRIVADAAQDTLIWGRRTLHGAEATQIALEVNTWHRDQTVKFRLAIDVGKRWLRAPLGSGVALGPEPELVRTIAACLSGLRAREALVREVHEPPPGIRLLVALCGVPMILLGLPLSAVGVWAVIARQSPVWLIFIVLFLAIALYGVDLIFRFSFPPAAGGLFAGKLGRARAVGGLVLSTAMLLTTAVMVVMEFRAKRVLRMDMFGLPVIFAPMLIACARVLFRRS